jgi:ribosomal-protein-alanine N-acetyltransferase
MRRRGSFTLVAENDADADAEHKITGFLVAHSGAKGHIITIDVVEAGRRSGVGSQMLQAAEDRLRRSGARAVTLETAVDNHTALAFYKRHGYEVVGTIPGYYSTGIDALSLIKQWAVVSDQ